MKEKMNMKKRIYIATVCSQHREIIRKYGSGVELDQFCTAVNMDGSRRTEGMEEIREILKDTDRKIFHAPFNELFPAAIDPRARSLAMDRFNEAAMIAMELGSKKMVVHSGYVPFVYFKEWHVEKSAEFWTEFMEDKPDDFNIVIENVLEDEPYTMVKLMENIDDPRIRLCLDAGHALCAGKTDVMEWLEVMAPYLGHLHIHNNNGEYDYHSPLMEGLIDYGKFLDRAAEICPDDMTVTIECLDGLSSMKWLKEKGYLG